jgi:hypothetical protein
LESGKAHDLPVSLDRYIPLLETAKSKSPIEAMATIPELEIPAGFHASPWESVLNKP